MLKIAWAPEFVLPLPPGHRFPMEKYELLPEQLIHEGTINEQHLFVPSRKYDGEISITHEQHYLTRLQQLQLTPSEIRKSGFPLTRELVEREWLLANGTIEAALFALQFGAAGNSAGGTHHAFANRAEGFCLLNDIAVAANHLILHQLAQRILVIDLDVHQGNGTAALFNNDDRVFTFSMHGEKNYPLHKESSDLDIGLPDGTDDRLYLYHLKHQLPRVIDSFTPDFVFYQAGVDILQTDLLGRLKISRDGCAERDRFVLQLCKNYGIPVVITMGGGYSKNIRDIVESHANTYRFCQQIFF
jgi:acetoin utilization deacetylase AcuC-like enzyme